MAGIVFFGTERLDRTVEFYLDEVDAERWIDQDGCTILRHDDFRFGFCEREAADTGGTLTFYYDDRDGVDAMYDRLASRARGPPRVNEQYDIYQFFADDPEGRTVEFQTFLHPVEG